MKKQSAPHSDCGALCFLFVFYFILPAELIGAGEIRQIHKPRGNVIQAVSAMGNQTITAILDIPRTVYTVPPALFAQSVKRAVTEQAVEILRVLRFMAGKILTFPVLKK